MVESCLLRALGVRRLSSFSSRRVRVCGAVRDARVCLLVRVCRASSSRPIEGFSCTVEVRGSFCMRTDDEGTMHQGAVVRSARKQARERKYTNVQTKRKAGKKKQNTEQEQLVHPSPPFTPAAPPIHLRIALV